MAEAPLAGTVLQVRDVAGKGRGLFATRLIQGGEVVLREAPLLLYPQPSVAGATCAHCLRLLAPPGAAGLALHALTGLCKCRVARRGGGLGARRSRARRSRPRHARSTTPL